MAQLPESEVVNIQKVKVNISEMDLPGFPKRREHCSVCGERIMDGREVTVGNRVLCRACVNGKYYEIEAAK